MKRELLNMMNNSDQNLVSNAMKMISPEVLELGNDNFNIEGIKLTQEMASFLMFIHQDKFQTKGISIDLTSISSPTLVKTVDELNLKSKPLGEKQVRLLSAIEAKRDFELKNNQLKKLRTELAELETKLEWIRNLGKDEKRLDLVKKMLNDSQKEMTKAKSREDEIDGKILSLVETKRDLENLVTNQTNAIGDIEEQCKIIDSKRRVASVRF